MSDLSAFSKEFLHEQCLKWEKRARLANERIAELEKAIDMALTAIDSGESRRDIAAALQEVEDGR